MSTGGRSPRQRYTAPSPAMKWKETTLTSQNCCRGSISRYDTLSLSQDPSTSVGFAQAKWYDTSAAYDPSQSAAVTWLTCHAMELVLHHIRGYGWRLLLQPLDPGGAR